MHHAFKYCSVNKDGKVIWITIQRPEVLNALHYPAHAELEEVFDRFSEDTDAWVAVITGSGDRSFCAGSDLKYISATNDGTIPTHGFAGITHRPNLNKPVIACVNGLAVGGGFEIVLACDLVVTAEHAKFGFPEPKVGLAPVGGGGMHRLARQISLKKAMELLLTGRLITADEAISLGLVYKSVQLKDLIKVTEDLIGLILKGAPLAIRATKQATMDGLQVSLQEALSSKHPDIIIMETSNDAKEGPLAFSQKRPPQWTAT